MADLSVNVLTFENTAISPANQPQLSCTAANQLTLAASSLRLGNGREIAFSDAGQIRSLDDNHRLVFNRLNSTLELHEQGSISFLTGGPPPVERLRILESGNVGIGTASPQAKLQVTDGAMMPAIGNSPQAGIQFPPNPGGGGGDEAFIRYFPTVGETTKLMIGIGNDADDTIGFQQMGAERLTISNGNVGIGTTAPLYALEVKAANGIKLGLEGNGGGQLIIGNNANDNRIFLEAYSADGNGHAAELLLTGRFAQPVPQISLVADTTLVTGKLDVKNSLGVKGAILFSNTDGNKVSFSNQDRKVKLTMVEVGFSPTFPPPPPLTYEFAIGHIPRFHIGGSRFTTVFSVNQDGQGFLSNKLIMTSDGRLKTNIQPLGPVLDKLQHIRGVSFNWNDVAVAQGRSALSREIGVIAQELESAFPELVVTMESDQSKAVDYSRMTAVLLEAIKELQVKIKNLEQQVAC